MFTGIIESIGTVFKIEEEASNKHFYVRSSISNQLKIDQSVAHNGVCLTVVEIDKDVHVVTAIDETLQVSNLSELKTDTKINLERCLLVGDRIDGHFVQGHVDATAICKNIINENGSWRFYFGLQSETDQVLIPKGSITINGVSLTLVDAELNHFSVAIIPYTYENTIFKYLNEKEFVNIEFDLLGKYMQRFAKKQLIHHMPK